jgi:molybdate transport system substrate-binding protein
MKTNTKNNGMRNAAVFIIFALLVAGCAQKEETTGNKEITVFAAASLTGAFGEIKGGFEKDNPGTSVVCNFDGTQALRTQVEQGAYGDVFASANTKHMNALKAEGLVLNETVSNFAKNRIVIIVPRDNRKGIQNFSDLAKPGTKIVMGTKDVPCGSYALQVLDRIANDTSYGPDYKKSVLDNVLSQETVVTGIIAKTAAGEADAGFAYYSDVTEDAKEKLTKIEIPEEYNVVAEYPIAVLTESRDKEEAQRFIGYVESEKGREVLAKYGFTLT